jgi:hypothetical protein
MKTIDPAENPKVEHRIREFLKALNSGGGKPIEALTPAEARKVLVDAQASVPLDLPACDIEEKTIKQDGLKVSLNIVRPGGSKAVLPAFIFIHGGGWILSDFPTHERFVRDLVVDSGFTAVFVNYTPSPDATARSQVSSLQMPWHYASVTPLGRLGEPADIAAVAVFLASDSSFWVTGESIRAGGGRSLRPFGREHRDSSGRLLDQRFISIWDTPPALPNRRHRRGAFLPQAASA